MCGLGWNRALLTIHCVTSGADMSTMSVFEPEEDILNIYVDTLDKTLLTVLNVMWKHVI